MPPQVLEQHAKRRDPNDAAHIISAHVRRWGYDQSTTFAHVAVKP